MTSIPVRSIYYPFDSIITALENHRCPDEILDPLKDWTANPAAWELAKTLEKKQ